MDAGLGFGVQVHDSKGAAVAAFFSGHSAGLRLTGVSILIAQFQAADDRKDMLGSKTAAKTSPAGELWSLAYNPVRARRGSGADSPISKHAALPPLPVF